MYILNNFLIIWKKKFQSWKTVLFTKWGLCYQQPKTPSETTKWRFILPWLNEFGWIFGIFQFVKQFTHVSGHHEALSRKQKLKFRKNCFYNLGSDMCLYCPYNDIEKNNLYNWELKSVNFCVTQFETKFTLVSRQFKTKNIKLKLKFRKKMFCSYSLGFGKNG